jgi:hypothetical protein
MASSTTALERAKQCALAGSQPAANPAQRPVAATYPQRFVQVPARGKTYKVTDPQWTVKPFASRA